MGRRGHNFASAQVYPSGHDREINHCGARRDTRSGRIPATSKVDPFSAMAQPSPQLQVPCPGVARRAIGGQYLLRTITPEERHVREGHACRATKYGGEGTTGGLTSHRARGMNCQGAHYFVCSRDRQKGNRSRQHPGFRGGVSGIRYKSSASRGRARQAAGRRFGAACALLVLASWRVSQSTCRVV